MRKNRLAMLLVILSLGLMGCDSSHKTLIFPDGGRYIGSVENGKAHGQGNSYAENGNILHEGSYQNGLRHGLHVN